jgi:PIN domain nuclease of toxin-antitoxin system
VNYLLDTHTFLWFINDDAALSTGARRLIEAPENTVFLSIASIWEIAIKVSLGKLILPTPFVDFINQQMALNRILPLAIETKHIQVIVTLPFHHRDPFDRLLIAQALVEKMVIIGQAAAFDAYLLQRE